MVSSRTESNLDENFQLKAMLFKGETGADVKCVCEVCYTQSEHQGQSAH